MTVIRLMLRLLPSFAPWLDEKEESLPPISMSCKRLRHYPTFVYYVDSSRGIPTDVDGESSLISTLTAFGNSGGHPAPITNFFRSVGNVFNPITEYQPSAGSLLVRHDLPTAWYSVIEPIHPQRLTHLVSLESLEVAVT
jgi:hypothetical protein